MQLRLLIGALADEKMLHGHSEEDELIPRHAAIDSNAEDL
jgi:hypothetical protein